MTKNEAELTARIGSTVSAMGGFACGYLVAAQAPPFFTVAAFVVMGIGVAIVAGAFHWRMR